MPFIVRSVRVARRLSFAIVLLSVGCGLFDPRAPEDPAGEEVPYTTPADTETLLQNLIDSTEDLSTANFTLDLAQEGVGDLADFEFWFDYGDIVSEEKFLYQEVIAALDQLLGNPTDGVTLVWGEPVQKELTGDTEIHRNRPYELVFSGSASDGGDIRIAGLATLYFRETGARWYLYKWEDLDDGSVDKRGTWGWALLHPSLTR